MEVKTYESNPGKYRLVYSPDDTWGQILNADRVITTIFECGDFDSEEDRDTEISNLGLTDIINLQEDTI